MHMGDGPEPVWAKAIRNEESSKTTNIRELEEQIRVKDTLIAELKDSIAQKDEQLKVLQTNIKTLLDEGCEKINKRIELESLIGELEEKLKEQKEKTRKWKDKAKKSKWRAKAKKYKSLINNNYTEKITNEDGSMKKDLLKPRMAVEGEK